jgi:hypothetical protein
MRLGGRLELLDVRPVDHLGPRPGGGLPDRDPDHRPTGEDRKIQISGWRLVE